MDGQKFATGSDCPWEGSKPLSHDAQIRRLEVQLLLSRLHLGATTLTSQLGAPSADSVEGRYVLTIY